MTAALHVLARATGVLQSFHDLGGRQRRINDDTARQSPEMQMTPRIMSDARRAHTQKGEP